jgi:hypothetical protein
VFHCAIASYLLVLSSSHFAFASSFFFLSAAAASSAAFFSAALCLVYSALYLVTVPPMWHLKPSLHPVLGVFELHASPTAASVVVAVVSVDLVSASAALIELAMRAAIMNFLIFK